MQTDLIDYPNMIDLAMRQVVQRALAQVLKSGLPGEHHFYITFLTQYPGVQISDALRSRYPDEMTIVIQHQFWDLKVDNDQFSLMLSFSNVPEKLVIPFAALTAFADPSVKFGLQFHRHQLPTGQDNRADNEAEEAAVEITGTDDSKIITLDAFRKK